MSTKIYNGFRINTGSPVGNLNLLTTLQATVQSLVDTKSAALHAERIAHAVDSFCLTRFNLAMKVNKEPTAEHQETCKRYIWWSVSEGIRKEQRECRAGAGRSPEVDCDVTLFLRADPENGMLYGYLQEERVGVYAALCKLPGIEDYAYWNNTDRPDELTDEQWEERRSNWNRILDSGIACLQLQFEPSDMGPSATLPHLPAIEERARKRAVSVIENRILHNWQMRKERRGAKRTGDMSGLTRMLFRIRDAMADGGRLSKPLANLTSLFEHVLPPDLSALLQGKFEDILMLMPGTDVDGDLTRGAYYRHKYGGIYQFVESKPSGLSAEGGGEAGSDRLAVFKHVWPFDESVLERPLAEFKERFVLISAQEVRVAMSMEQAEAQELVARAKSAGKA